MSLVLSEGINPAIDRVILDRAEYERLRSINAELLGLLQEFVDCRAEAACIDDCVPDASERAWNSIASRLRATESKARAAIERAKA